MKTKKNLKNSMKGVAAFSFAAAMVLSLSAFNTVDKKKLTVVADPLTELASTDQSKADNDLARLRQSPYESTFKATLAEYNHEIESREKACEAWHTWRSGDRSAKAEADVAWARENYGTNTRHIRKEITAWQTLRSMYVSRAQAILNMPTLDGSGTLLASSGNDGAMASFSVPAKKSVQEINEVMLAGLKLWLPGCTASPPPISPKSSISRARSKVSPRRSMSWRNWRKTSTRSTATTFKA